MKSEIIYIASDGKAFETHEKAKAHQLDLIGEELDAFIPQDKRGHLGRFAKQEILLEILARKELQSQLEKLLALVECLNSKDDEE